MLHFVSRLKGGVIPAEFLSSIEMGLREEAEVGRPYRVFRWST